MTESQKISFWAIYQTILKILNQNRRDSIQIQTGQYSDPDGSRRDSIQIQTGQYSDPDGSRRIFFCLVTSIDFWNAKCQLRKRFLDLLARNSEKNRVFIRTLHLRFGNFTISMLRTHCLSSCERQYFVIEITFLEKLPF